MALAPGTRLGPYEISALIGQGGMGMVYRATDTNLKRAVAIKVLPDALAADVERIARFQREAEVLASLNHVNIAHVHGLEKMVAPRPSSWSSHEGPTLEERIARGPIRWTRRSRSPGRLQTHRCGAQAVDRASPISSPRISLRLPGTVKVLDFGLAKGFDAPAASPAQLANSPTMTTPAGTVGGMIVGTPAFTWRLSRRGERRSTSVSTSGRTA